MNYSLFYDMSYCGYKYNIVPDISGQKTVYIMEKDNLLAKYQVETLTEAESTAKAFIDGVLHVMDKQETYQCTDCGFTASVKELERMRGPCCEAKPLFLCGTEKKG
jgi:rubrerythrin